MFNVNVNCDSNKCETEFLWKESEKTKYERTPHTKKCQKIEKKSGSLFGPAHQLLGVWAFFVSDIWCVPPSPIQEIGDL